MARYSRQVALEDVPLIIALYEHGLSESAIGAAFSAEARIIARVLNGWRPQPRAVLIDLEHRKAVAKDRKTKAVVARVKPRWQIKAHEAVYQAVKDGTLHRGPCFCGSRRVQAHHHLGYAEEHRLDVIWLCAQHHKDAHPNNSISKEP